MLSRVAALLLLAWPGIASAQRLDLSLYALSGSGLSAAPGDGQTLTRRSPQFLDIEVGAEMDAYPTWEWTAGFIAELEGRMSFGINPQVKKIHRLGRFGYYATGGVPAFFSPFTLFGFEIGGGGLYSLSQHTALVVEARADFFFAGSDLADESMLSKFDVGIGFRVGL